MVWRLPYLGLLLHIYQAYAMLCWSVNEGQLAAHACYLPAEARVA
jgi:hypothetical protein